MSRPPFNRWPRPAPRSGRIRAFLGDCIGAVALALIFLAALYGFPLLAP